MCVCALNMRFHVVLLHLVFDNSSTPFFHISFVIEIFSWKGECIMSCSIANKWGWPGQPSDILINT